MKKPLIALLTDFGNQDPFVGIMKGVVANIAPEVRTVDLSHEIPPGDILRAAMALWHATGYFPPGTVFLCVVDPGVGTTRRPIVLVSDQHTFIGPDNGLLSFVCGKNYSLWEIRNPAYMLPKPSHTFHGRDLFAPAAAHIASGVPPSSMGPASQGLIRLPNPQLQVQSDDQIIGQVLFSDRFGNLLTSLGRFEERETSVEFIPWLEEVPGHSGLTGLSLLLPSGEPLAIAKTFGQIEPGACAGIIGSSGLLEIAANGERAAQLLNLGRGDTLKLTFRS